MTKRNSHTNVPSMGSLLTAALVPASIALALYLGFQSIRTPSQTTNQRSPTNQVSVVEGIANAAKGLYSGITSSSDRDTLSELRAHYAFLQSGLRSSDPYVKNTAIKGTREYLQNSGLLGTQSRLMGETPMDPRVLTLSQEMNDLLDKNKQ